MSGRRGTLRERFEAKADRAGGPDACHLWTGWKSAKGYGQLSSGARRYKAHRLAWQMENGEIPDGMMVCHRCDNPSCVNTRHMWVGSHEENMADMILKGRSPRSVGPRNGQAKLSSEQVAELRRRRSAGESVGALAREFGVCDRHVWMIATWRSRKEG